MKLLFMAAFAVGLISKIGMCSQPHMCVEETQSGTYHWVECPKAKHHVSRSTWKKIAIAAVIVVVVVPLYMDSSNGSARSAHYPIDLKSVPEAR